MSLEIRVVALCDDVRAEISGKHTLVGLYGDKVNVPSKPAVMQMKLFFNLGLTGEGSEIEIEVTFNRTNIHKASIPKGFSLFNATIPLAIFMIDDRPLIVRVREAGQEWGDSIKWDYNFEENAVELPEEQAASIRDQVKNMPNDVVKLFERQG
ncbi:hypothetical protein [Caulobacter sp. LjRoot300]|uniref:hypothetical protein n=1 Tax=Caulobacter sp. LjRoot300 TaxID=3342321 RepID=UPI003ECE00CC